MDEDTFYDTSDSEPDDVSVKDDRFFSMTSGATHNPGGNGIALTVAKTVSTQLSADPKTAAVDGSHLVKPPDVTNEATVLSNVINNHVVRIKDSSYGHSQDNIYDWHELEPSSLASPVLDNEQIYEMEKWIKDMPTRKLKALAIARAKDEEWNHWQRCLAWFPLKII